MIYELRQYTLWPGERETLIELFDREFVESQEAAGIRVDGQFLDEDRPDHFVWVRSFPDMGRRTAALTAFYGGPAWQAHRDAANATMVDSDDVLLLKPAGPVWELPAERRPQGTPAVLTASIAHLPSPVTQDFRDFFAAEVAPLAPVIARFETEYAENTFPDLPVRTGEHVWVWFTRGDVSPGVPALEKWLTGPVQTLRLTPTARSLLR
ncbi:NIPSNAP family protein [Phytohabitans houttuyneae]|uniref:NIPSNAP family containing protein n=1 Tax=Phytohabitans houttuyneae TaxID=1076126 RepID=A0A6V8K534_9ACTN|nr:NIPSNAP family protein [Phytohabitans houttuyneae]GFJ77106.1 NIPSNAP family containing protein [Phytohabitans houttuyneae]